MNNKRNTQNYERKVTGAERFFSHAPFATVTMVARIKGEVTEARLATAIKQIQQRHILLRCRIRDTDNGEIHFTSDEVGEIPVEIVPRKSENDWIKIHADKLKIPHEFEIRPAIRFVLVQSREMSELIILCHHSICDGMSLAYLARDIMVHLGSPSTGVKALPDPEPISLTNIPCEIAPSGFIKYVINKIKKTWSEEYESFTQEDYESINKAYWENYRHEILVVEFSVTDTTNLVQRCRKEKVTVNTALATAFSGAQNAVTEPQPHHVKTVCAVSLRNRLPISPGEGMGYYAQGLEIDFKYNSKKSFWDNARRYHKKFTANTSNKKVFGNLPTFLAMDSNIYEALNFKKLGRLVKSDDPRYEKLNSFSKRNDVIVRLLQRAKMETLDAKLIGPAITNLGRLDFSTIYGDLELDRLIMQPGGAFPLVHVDMVIGAVTCAGKLSLVVEYAEEAVDTATMKEIKTRALKLLLGR